ncbi:MAG TPA: hypothetical protein DCE41_34010, partial [Cytophagales bacterium]|nr:hypothetical protein [Cytophagales bacterium]
QQLFAEGASTKELGFVAEAPEARAVELTEAFVAHTTRTPTTVAPTEATKYLGFIASRMQSLGLVSLELRDLQYTWTRLSNRQRLGATMTEGLVVGLSFGLVIGLSFGLSFGLVAGLGSSLVGGLGSSLVRGLVLGLLKYSRNTKVDIITYVGIVQGTSMGQRFLSRILEDWKGILGLSLVGGLVLGLYNGLVGGLV